MGRKQKVDTELSIEVWKLLSHLRNASAPYKDEKKDIWIPILLQAEKLEADIDYTKSPLSAHLLLGDILGSESEDLIEATWHMKGKKKKATDFIREKLSLDENQVICLDAKENKTKRQIKVIFFNFAKNPDPEKSPLLDARKFIESNESPADVFEFIKDGFMLYSNDYADEKDARKVVTPTDQGKDGGTFGFNEEAIQCESSKHDKALVFPPSSGGDDFLLDRMIGDVSSPIIGATATDEGRVGDNNVVEQDSPDDSSHNVSVYRRHFPVSFYLFISYLHCLF